MGRTPRRALWIGGAVAVVAAVVVATSPVGFNVIGPAWGALTGTTGLEEECAPSLTDDLWGLSEPMLGYLKSGYAVAMADYQGLGEVGEHPYLDSKTAGLNVIDSVRALRHTFPGVSDRWLAFGGSQGGGATWATDELAASYAPELTLVGAVANSPAADVTGIVDKAQTRPTDHRSDAAVPDHRRIGGPTAPRGRPR